MKYWKVKPTFDNKSLCVIKHGHYVNAGDILIANELYTIKEYQKLVDTRFFGFAPYSAVELVEIPKNRVYWFFGARFECKRGCND